MPKILALKNLGEGQIGVILEDGVTWDGTVQLLTATEVFKLKIDARKDGERGERERLNDVERTKEVHEELVNELRAARELIDNIRDIFSGAEMIVRDYTITIKLEV
jgi:hypothetical protein